MKPNGGILAAIFLVALSSQMASFAQVVSERIFFLKEDGQHYLSYTTNRTGYSSYNLWYDKKHYPDLDAALKNVLYFYPNEYRWNTTSDPEANLLQIPQGSYAVLEEGQFNPGETFQPTADGGWTYTNWDGKTRTSSGHYGHWNDPDDFAQFVYVWVVPEKFELVSYRCNRPGQWVKRKNTIAYYGKNVNDLVFTITYRPRGQAAYRALHSLAEQRSEFSVEQVSEGIKLTLGATVLFASGSSALSEAGKSVLQKVAASLKSQRQARIVVSGFTDNAPIQGALKERFPTNWELSAARALAVVHYLSSLGIDESRMEARAYGAQRPIASNATAEGRAKNRRIEILIAQGEGE